VTTPMCSNKKCIACKTDSECVTRNGADPGVCLASGACATDADVIYVQQIATCTSSPGQGGTRVKPYCNPQIALGGASLTRNTIILRPPGVFELFWYDGFPAVLNVVGQGDLLQEGIIQSSGILNLRNFNVRNLSGPGIYAGGNSSLNIDGLVLRQSTGGGIVVAKVDTAVPSFDIRNTIVAENGDGTSTTPGGLVLAVGSGVHRLTHVTIANNTGPGLNCDKAIDMVGLILSNNRFANVSPQCGEPVCCTGAAQLDQNFRLMSGSTCIDKVPANMSLPHDIDGHPRPQGAASDCGADEFVP
jgi:hypothetical protein